MLLFPPLRLQPAVHTAAEILPVQIIFPGKGNRALIAALFLEIRVQPRDAVLLRQFRSSGVNKHRVFMGTDGERCADKIRCRCLHCGSPKAFFQSVPDAFLTACSPFRLLLQSLCQRIKPFRRIIAVQNCHRMRKRHGLHQPFQFRLPVEILLLRRNVGIIKEQGNRKIPAQIFQHIAAARRTAGVEKQHRNPICRERFQQPVSFQLIIDFGLHLSLLRQKRRLRRRRYL